ncbi:MAG: cbb3-type cytochrome oxidase assembly protein CcoS [Algoriphagus sp.]|uniref:cbb3-type cytochrome oxidase assembly protein CcoS n=1 Tax=Algoriphagus sp. TaxID=1872435 RepID=UPI0017F07557|nr:cbb3-type cytochrome oxidase assembly protein CcoS [Algoriphagus sp.]NVJ87345.1 cbb3-type cytochrome oxidase assembly protein CcoS [Algoriphagus sp.]
MEVIFLLIGVSLVLAGSFLYLFFKAVKSGQFEDDYTPSVRILFDNHKKTSKHQPIKPKSNE